MTDFREVEYDCTPVFERCFDKSRYHVCAKETRYSRHFQPLGQPFSHVVVLNSLNEALKIVQSERHVVILSPKLYQIKIPRRNLAGFYEGRKIIIRLFVDGCC
jgi:hypothetical protein